MPESSAHRAHSLREVFNVLRYIARSGLLWRQMPHDLPPWQVVYQQTRRWMEVGVFEELLHDLRELIRVADKRNTQPSAVILDSRTPCSRRRKAAHGPAMTGPSAARARRCIWQWIRSDSCSPCG